MSQANDLLNSISEPTAGTVTEGNLIIGRDRYIVVPESLKKVGVQYDHNVETVTFDCPRYWDEWDFATMKIYINYMREDGKVGIHLCDNVVVDAHDNTLIHFDWTISGHVTAVRGQLSFLVCIKNVNTEGTEITHWNSELNTEMYISEGLKCQPTILKHHPDIITQLLTRMDGVDERTSYEALAAHVEKFLREEEAWFRDLLMSEEFEDIVENHLNNNGVIAMVDIVTGVEQPDHPCLWFNTNELNVTDSDVRDNFEVNFGDTKPNFECLWMKSSN